MPDIRETRVRASSVVQSTVTGILAIPTVLHEPCAWQILTGACKAPEGIEARVVAGSVPVAQQTLIDVFMGKIDRYRIGEKGS